MLDHPHVNLARTGFHEGFAGTVATPRTNRNDRDQQEAVITKSLVRQPDLMFDEPTRGVDVGAIVEILELINRECESPICEGVNSLLNATKQS